MNNIQSLKNISIIYKKFLEFEDAINSESELIGMLKMEQQEKKEILKLAQNLYFGAEKPNVIDNQTYESLHEDEIYYISTDKNKISQLLLSDTIPNNYSNMDGIFCTNLNGYAEMRSKEFGIIDSSALRLKLNDCHYCDFDTVSYLADHLFVRSQQNREIKTNTEFDFKLNQIRNFLVSQSDLETNNKYRMSIEFLNFLKNNPSILAVMLEIDCLTKDDIYEIQDKESNIEKIPFTWFSVLNREKMVTNKNEVNNILNEEKISQNEPDEKSLT